LATTIIWSNKQAQGTIVEEGVADWSGDFTFTIPSNSEAKLTLDIQGLGLLMQVVITINRNTVYDNWFSPNQQGATIQVPVTLTEGTHNGSVYIHAGLPWGGENYILWTETLNMKIDYAEEAPSIPLWKVALIAFGVAGAGIGVYAVAKSGRKKK